MLQCTVRKQCLGSDSMYFYELFYVLHTSKRFLNFFRKLLYSIYYPNNCSTTYVRTYLLTFLWQSHGMESKVRFLNFLFTCSPVIRLASTAKNKGTRLGYLAPGSIL